MRIALVFVLFALALPASAPAFLDAGDGTPRTAEDEPAVREPATKPRPKPQMEALAWRDSVALGTPSDGRLVRGVRFPAAGARFFTWDPLLHRRPNRAWRRHGTDDLVRLVLRIVDAYARAHPQAPRLGIGDISRPRGGYFGPRHVSHQNGLDVDVYYPRLDRRERPPKRPGQIDRQLAQDLVYRFVRAGAERVFVGPSTNLTGPPQVVQVLGGHDNHIHVRIGGTTR